MKIDAGATGKGIPNTLRSAHFLLSWRTFGIKGNYIGMLNRNAMKTLSAIIVSFAMLSQTLGQIAKVQFDYFTLEIEQMELWEQSKILDTTFLSDAELNLEYGETPEGAIIHVVGSKLANHKIEIRYETSITIMNEGPHCDLINWKHYTSAWLELEGSKPNTFVATSYSQEDKGKFPVVSVDEIIKAVEEQCPGREEHAQTIKSPNEYPGRVDVSRFYLRISGTDDSGKGISRTLIFNVPMGC